MGALCMEQLCGMNLHYQHHSLEYFLDRQVELGLKNVELWGGSPHLYIDDASPERVHTVRNAIQSRGLNPVCYTPETVVYPINIAAEEEHIRWRSLQYLSRGLRLPPSWAAAVCCLRPDGGTLGGRRSDLWSTPFNRLKS